MSLSKSLSIYGEREMKTYVKALYCGGKIKYCIKKIALSKRIFDIFG
jgi:hypothetical protein